MMISKALFIGMMIITAIFSVNAVYASPVETFEFTDDVTKVRFQALSKELRCPKCQNQNLADSNSTVASALRLDLYNLLIQGKSDTEIVDLMVGRYGEFVLYRPRVSSVTYVLWFGPALLILIGIIVVIIILRKKPATKESLSLDSEQQAQLQQLLHGNQAQTSQDSVQIPTINKDEKE